LDISANLNPGEWTEVVGKKGKKMKSKKSARSVASGPSNNQAGTNLRSAHAVPMSHVMSGGNQVRVPSTGFAYSLFTCTPICYQNLVITHNLFIRIQSNQYYSSARFN
jgi:hypothetical protein